MSAPAPLPDPVPPGPATARDRARQVAVAVCAVIAVVGGFLGSGAVIGTPIAEAAGGALAADATPVAPGTGAFQIWGPIYLGLLAYAVWQFLRPQAGADRHRRLGLPLGLSMVLNAAWILSVQAGLLALSVPVIVALLAVLAWAFRIAATTVSTRTIDAVITDGTIGLYLGWVSVATAANITAWLSAAGFRGFGAAPDVWSVGVVLVAGAVGVAVAIWGRGRIAPTLALCWGLAWVAVARLGGAPHSVPTAVAALVAVLAVLAVTLRARLRPLPHPRPLA